MEAQGWDIPITFRARCPATKPLLLLHSNLFFDRIVSGVIDIGDIDA
jgi:hypothetical protein